MKVYIRKFLKFILKKSGVVGIIRESINEYIEQSNRTSFVGSEKVKLYPQSRISNGLDRKRITIGDGTHVVGFLTLFGSGGNIDIGNYVYIGENTRIWSQESIKIGSNVLISHHVNIMDSDSHEIDILERRFSTQYILDFGLLSTQGSVKSAPIVIEDDVWIGFNCTVLKGVTIGKGSIIASNSVVTKNVEPMSLMMGNPAKFVRKLG
jgi:acetyltransferase-like isoleucine patch superfamily enzyme